MAGFIMKRSKMKNFKSKLEEAVYEIAKELDIEVSENTVDAHEFCVTWGGPMSIKPEDAVVSIELTFQTPTKHDPRTHKDLNRPPWGIKGYERI